MYDETRTRPKRLAFLLTRRRLYPTVGADGMNDELGSNGHVIFV